MARKLVLATRNQDKVYEIKNLLVDLDLELLTLEYFPGAPEVVEDRDSLEENAIKKAVEVSEFVGLPAVADDTGLEVEFLNGAPGVYSSRFAGENATYSDNVQKLLTELKVATGQNRKAVFRTVVAFRNGSETYTVTGSCAGRITEEPSHSSGFGYDPVFEVPELGKTFAELEIEEKNKISHRGKAFQNFRELLIKVWFQ